MARKILVVDDEKLIVKGIKASLEQDDFTVDAAYDGEEGLSLAEKNQYAAILLDLMLPKIDGMELCRRIREFSKVPVVMLTAKGDDMDKILGFETGADDYITKPFNIVELKARIKAIIRRAAPKEEPGEKRRRSVGGVEIIASSRRAFIEGKEIHLTSKEYDMLEYLMKNPGKVYSREDLLRELWDGERTADLRVVDVHVRRLREKIEENPKEPRFIITKWGVGYYFDA
ncbi:MAG: response regulator transcription factor [Clostridiales bacterium]|nr:response regulator transcription factor [Clostridiales bacterium]